MREARTGIEARAGRSACQSTKWIGMLWDRTHRPFCNPPSVVAAVRTAQVDSVVAVDFPHRPIDTSVKGPDASALVVELPAEVKGSPIQVGGDGLWL